MKRSEVEDFRLAFILLVLELSNKCPRLTDRLRNQGW